jgi:hypothetical protein
MKRRSEYNFRSDFFWIANKPKEFAPRVVHSTDHDIRQRQYCQSWFWSHGESGAPRQKHVQLEGQFRSLVHTLCV